MAKDTSHKKLADAARAIAQVAPRESAVLVVEDDPDLQWRLARMLTINGNRVVGTSSADGALALIAEWSVDLVLIDEGLPGMTGLDLAKAIRKQRPEISVVLMTGDENEATRRAAKLAGAFTCLTKPFRTEALVEVLRALPAF
ncbi:MAG: response regulator [Sandaracinaceae bacterium]|nr:response regulator [Sandaracinaceae bacterium]